MPSLRSEPLSRFAAVAILTFATALPCLAEEAPEAEPPRTVLKTMTHIDVNEVRGVLNLLEVPFAIKPDQDLIVLRGPSHLLDTALKALDALDTPRPTIDLHVSVLAASDGPTEGLPKDLEPTVVHLRNLFGYEGFQLLDNVYLKVLEGREGLVAGGIPLGDGAERTGYRLSFNKVSVVPDDGEVKIRLKGLKFEVDGKASGVWGAGLITDVEVRAGQKAVVGSSTSQGIGQTLILILHATVSPDRASEASP